MGIEQSGIGIYSVGQLLERNLSIPRYQRPYSWREDTVRQLFLDLQDGYKNRLDSGASDSPQILGVVILHRNGPRLDIVDGQQRTITLKILLKLLSGELDATLSYPTESSPALIACRALSSELNRIVDPEEREGLKDHVLNHCQVVCVETEDIDEAFRVFDSQNFRGKALAPHDLLKAHHLREMRGESNSTKTAVVEQWETAGDSALDELFSTYLYRIIRWSMGKDVSAFSIEDLDLFKGIPANVRLSPSARYHVAAQSSVPLMHRILPAMDDIDDYDALRSQYQIDARQMSGKHFFDMAAFMISELDRLKAQAFPDPHAIASPSRAQTFGDVLKLSRYQKVTELYLAAALYYINKFSGEETPAALDHIFKWSYSVRINKFRVLRESINIAALGLNGEKSPFTELRNSANGREVRLLKATFESPRSQKDSGLAALLRQGHQL